MTQDIGRGLTGEGVSRYGLQEALADSRANLTRGEFGLRSKDRVGSTPTAPQPRPTPSHVRALIKAYYEMPGNGAGGNLHVTLDDGNIETGDILYCLGYAKRDGDTAGVQIAELLLAMTRRQRAKAVGR